jgi:hypothetical protein
MPKRLLLVLALLLALAIQVSAQADPITPDLIIDDFEAGVPLVLDESNTAVGFVPWGSEPGNVVLSARQIVGASTYALPTTMTTANTVLALDYDIGSWGGFTHAFTDGAAWTSMDSKRNSAL